MSADRNDISKRELKTHIADRYHLWDGTYVIEAIQWINQDTAVPDEWRSDLTLWVIGQYNAMLEEM